MNYNIQKEVWKDVKGYEGHYQVSDSGKVRSLDRNIQVEGRSELRTLKGRMLKLITNNYGYKVVNFSKDGVHKKIQVHRLVAEAFIVTKKLDFQVNHKDGNKENNHISNLEFLSIGDNMRHAHSTGLIKNYAKKLDEEKVLEIRKMYAKDENLTLKEIASKYNVSDVSISKILRNKDWPKLPHYSTFK